MPLILKFDKVVNVRCEVCGVRWTVDTSERRLPKDWNKCPKHSEHPKQEG